MLHKKEWLHIGVLLFLVVLYIVGFDLVKYLLGIYVLALFFDAFYASIYFLILLSLLPFLVYFDQHVFAEEVASGAFILLLGGVLNSFLAYTRIPKINKRFSLFIVFVYFSFSFFSGLIKQLVHNGLLHL